MVRSLLALLLLGILSVNAGAVTPVAKVTELLESLASKVAEEGKEEAAAYDKYSCFCKEQADNHLYAIEKSRDHIAHLDAKISKLTSEIADLDADITQLGQDIDGLGNKIASNRQVRDGQHDAFLVKVADADGAIDAVERAIQALKESKKSLGGNAELEAVSLSQISGLSHIGSLAKAMEMSATGLAMLPEESQRLSVLATLGEPGKAYTYKYHANDIIASLQTVLASFKRTKASLESDEFNAKTAFELKQQALSNEKKFAEKEKQEKEALRASKDEEKSATEVERSEESSAKTSDENFMRVLKTDCEEKAGLWDQRSQARAAELTAIGEAVSALKAGVAPNWKANKKLVGLQKQVAAPGRVANKKATSFLQVQGVSLRGAIHRAGMSEGQLAAKVQTMLTSASHQVHSPLLAVVALKINAAEDHFVKVRQIIKDMIERLQTDAAAEMQKKTWCDEEMKNAVQSRDAATSKSEQHAADIEGKEAQKNDKEREVAELSHQIAQNKKALAEATELRNSEKAENTKTIAEAGVGKAEVERAINVLKQFYQADAAGLIQRSAFVPTDSNRDMQTVGDLRPDIFDSEYEGAQEASKGIIGMLEVILADFDRTDGAVTSAESDAAGKFDTFKNANEADTSAKEGLVDGLNSDIETLTGDLVQLRSQKVEADDNHQRAEKELNGLHSMCVAGEETYEERVAKRQQEIEALKEAHSILEDWQK